MKKFSQYYLFVTQIIFSLITPPLFVLIIVTKFKTDVAIQIILFILAILAGISSSIYFIFKFANKIENREKILKKIRDKIEKEKENK